MISNETLRTTFITPGIRYYLHKKLAHISPAQVDIRTEELLKFLNISHHCSGDIPFNHEVDEIWHLWILETQEYFALCQKLRGAPNSYIHHCSNDYIEFSNPEIKAQEPDMDRLFNILLTYVYNYGPFEAERIIYWPLALDIQQNAQLTVDEFNQWLFQVLREQSSLCA
ncbi:MAG TPA: hypothetical protein PKE57_00860 [Cellvibrionaceae bacterium]|nr:hypothetical protein [Cellvibrionaceae bacterium]HMW49255.1 hypothetical protein [Cellvibrionaceae bacterium]HMW71928.1 hypothetical protein [Cellvibrionaceae bacterium]HMY39409.1 hypothetical protein [Marinagarivorans sp.]HNG59291.1 hypothetical protein [Cellvibrionaceae bacterium]